MKKINIPFSIDDDGELNELAKNIRLSSFPELKENVNVILGQYVAYEECNGDPWALTPLVLSEHLKAALKSHYQSPPKGRLAYLKVLRTELSPDVCPMCGSLGAFSLDHVLPKDIYPEYSLYSRNLVPACSCNSKKGIACKGRCQGERAIHPYYDDFLIDPLYKTIYSGDFDTPDISVVVMDSARDHVGILEFHLREVILKNNILNWMIKQWSNFCIRGHIILGAILPAGELSSSAVKTALESYNFSKIAELGTPNNWWSILLYGLIDDLDRLANLADRLNSLRASGDSNFQCRR